jgi:hypothetical protein
MPINNEKLNITLSIEHRQFVPEIEKCFEGLDISVNPSH